MESYLIYIGKVSIAAGVFYLAFLLLFQNSKQFVFNRFYLPVSLGLSFIIPLITFTSIRYIQPSAPVDFSSFAYLPEVSQISVEPAFVPEWYHYLFVLYLIGLAGFLVHLTLGHLRAITIVKQSAIQKLYRIKVNITKKDVHPFSFFSKIVLSEKTLDNPNLEIIVKHENIHVKEKHTLDILFSEVLFLFQWFNPFAWLIKDAMKNNLEYKTDHQIAVNHNPQAYQLAMVGLADKKGVAPFLTALNGSQLKNRIIMMKKKTENKYAFVKQLVVLPLLAVLVMGLSNKEVRTEIVESSQIKSGLVSDMKRISPEYFEKIYQDGILVLQDYGDDAPMLILNDEQIIEKVIISESDLKWGRVIQPEQAVEQYGEKGKNGMMLFNTEREVTKSDVFNQNYIEEHFSDEISAKLVSENKEKKNVKGIAFSRENENPVGGVGIYNKFGNKLAETNEKGEFAFYIEDKKDNVIFVKEGFEPLHREIDLSENKKATIEVWLKMKMQVVVEQEVVSKFVNEYKEGKYDGPIFSKVDEMPQFPGGDLELRKFIARNVIYPTVAQENGIQGKVYIEFIINKKGKVIAPQIARGVDPALDMEALRVARSIPDWIPGKHKGETVNVSYTVPINFVLQGNAHTKKKSTGFGAELINHKVSISGVVTDKNGEIIEGARIYNRWGNQVAKTWNNGKFSFEPEENKETFVFVKNGFEPSFFTHTTEQSVQQILIQLENKDNNKQSKVKIRGKVTDKNGDPISGATIIVKGKTIGTITNKEGYYEIGCNEKIESLVFSMFGFKLQEIDVKNKKNIDVKLEVDENQKAQGNKINLSDSRNTKADIEKFGGPIFFMVEQMPQFPGGETALKKFIANSVKYPEIAAENGIQGKVYVSFIIDKKGNVQDAQVSRGVDPSLDKEAVRVVSKLPLWKPGKQNGKIVNVSYTVPVDFVMTNELKRKHNKLGLDGYPLKNNRKSKKDSKSDETVVVGYGTKDAAVAGKKSNEFKIRIGDKNINSPMYMVNGVEFTDISHINPNDIESISVLKDKSATELYGEKAKNGVVLICTKAPVLNEKLYIVDGKEYKGEIKDIAPDNISSISVLKNETTSSYVKIYGERAKNGVIIINTKTNYNTPSEKPLIVIDGIITNYKSMDDIDPENIKSVDVIKDKSAVAKYGEKAKNGVIEIALKTAKITSALQLRKFIGQEIKYPVLAQKANRQKKVKLAVQINKDGIIYSCVEDESYQKIRLDEVVVVAYKSKDNVVTGYATKEAADNAKNMEEHLLVGEAKRVINKLPTIDISEFKGKTVLFTVKFILQD